MTPVFKIWTIKALERLFPSQKQLVLNANPTKVPRKKGQHAIIRQPHLEPILYKYCVYVHYYREGPLKNQIFYVGQGKHELQRWARPYARREQLETPCGRATWQDQAYPPAGTGLKNFDVFIFWNNVSPEEADWAEILLIDLIGRIDSKKGILVNRTDGGSQNAGRLQSGRRTSARTRDKIRAAKRGWKASDETRRLWSIQRLGQPKSEETRGKMSLASLGVPKKLGECCHCGLKGAVNSLNRFHGEFCLDREGYQKRNRRYRFVINLHYNNVRLGKLEDKKTMVKNYFKNMTREEQRNSGLYKMVRGSTTTTKKIWGLDVVYSQVIDDRKKWFFPDLEKTLKFLSRDLEDLAEQV